MTTSGLCSWRLEVPIFVLVACGWLAPPTSADVHVVDIYGGGDFIQIQDAIDASTDGDTILVKGGGYATFTVDDKSLWIVADLDTRGFPVVIWDTVRVKNLSAGKSVFLYDITAIGVPSSPPQPGLSLTNNVGHVRAQECDFYGASGSPDRRGGSGADIASCFSVAFQQCTFTGGPGYKESECDGCYTPYESGGDGVSTAGSVLAFYDCTLAGGNATTNNWQSIAGDGGHGCDVQSFGFFASGSRFYGGRGGDATDWQAPQAGNGGHGVRVAAGAVQLLDNIYSGGQGGLAREGFPGDAGASTQGPGIVNFLIGDKRLGSADVEVGSGQSLSVSLIGQPGDRVYLPMVLTSNWRYWPAKLGVWLVPLPVKLTYTPIAILPASGTAVVQVPVPNLPQSEAVRQVFAQCLFLSAQGQFVLGSPLHIVIRN